MSDVATSEAHLAKLFHHEFTVIPAASLLSSPFRLRPVRFEMNHECSFQLAVLQHIPPA